MWARFGRREGVRENFGFSPEDRAIAVFITGHVEGKFLITAPTELEKLAKGDLLELKGLRGHGYRGWWGSSD